MIFSAVFKNKNYAWKKTPDRIVEFLIEKQKLNFEMIY